MAMPARAPKRTSMPAILRISLLRPSFLLPCESVVISHAILPLPIRHQESLSRIVVARFISAPLTIYYDPGGAAGVKCMQLSLCISLTCAFLGEWQRLPASGCGSEVVSEGSLLKARASKMELCGYAGDIKWRAHRFCRLQHKDLTIPASYLNPAFTACPIEEFSKALSGLGIGVRFHLFRSPKVKRPPVRRLCARVMIQGEQRNPTGFCRFQNIGIIGV